MRPEDSETSVGIRHHYCHGVAGGYLYYKKKAQSPRQAPAPVFKQRTRVHLDHSAYFNQKFNTPQEVTQACLECHLNAATDFMKTSHWQWVGPEEKIPGRKEPV